MAYSRRYQNHRPTTKEDRQVQIVTPREPTRDVSVCTNSSGPWGCSYPSQQQQQWSNEGPPRQNSVQPPRNSQMPPPRNSTRQSTVPPSRQNSMPPPQPQPEYGACGPDFCGCQMQYRSKEPGTGGGGGAYRQSRSPPPPQQPMNGNSYSCSNQGCCRTPAPPARASNANGISSMTWDQLRTLDLSNCTITITCGTGGNGGKAPYKDTGVNPEPVEEPKPKKKSTLVEQAVLPKNVPTKRRPRGLQEEPRIYSIVEKEEEKEEPASTTTTKVASETSSKKSTSSKSSASGESSESGSEGSSSTEMSGQPDGTSENASDSIFDEADKRMEDRNGRKSKRGPTGRAAKDAESETLGDQLLGSSSLDKPPIQPFAPDGSETQPINIGSESTLEQKVGGSDANSNVSVQAKRPSSQPSVGQRSDQSSKTRPVDELINEVIGGLQAKKIPVVWVYGYTQASLAETKAKCLRQIAEALDFAIVNTDLFHNKCTEINENTAGHSPEENQLAAYAHQLFSKAGVYSTLDTFDICAIYKAAIVLKQITAPAGSTPKGFILDEFPVNSLEGSQAEAELPSSPVGIYFLNSKCSESPDCEAEVEPPMKDLRGSAYTERAVNKAADDFGFKTVKVLNAEELDASQIGDIIELVEKHIKGQGLELHEAVEVEEEAPAATDFPGSSVAQEPKPKKKRKKTKK